MWAVAPERILKWGHVIFVMPLNFFGTVSRFGERFRDGQYSLVSFLLAVILLTVPLCTAICKCGGMRPTCPMESASMEVAEILPRHPSPRTPNQNVLSILTGPAKY